MPTEERFARLEDNVLDVHKQQAIMITKFDMHSEQMDKILTGQAETNSDHDGRIKSLEGAKMKLVAFATGVAAVSGAGVNTVWNFLKTSG